MPGTSPSRRNMAMHAAAGQQHAAAQQPDAAAQAPAAASWGGQGRPEPPSVVALNVPEVIDRRFRAFSMSLVRPAH